MSSRLTSSPPARPLAHEARSGHALNNHLMVLLFYAEALAARCTGGPESEDAEALLRSARALEAILGAARGSEAA